MFPAGTVSASSVSSGRDCAAAGTVHSARIRHTAGSTRFIRTLLASKCPTAVEQDRDRTVVDERDVHVGLEPSTRHLESGVPHAEDEGVVEGPRRGGGRGGVERRPAAPANIAEQR